MEKKQLRIHLRDVEQEQQQRHVDTFDTTQQLGFDSKFGFDDS